MLGNHTMRWKGYSAPHQTKLKKEAIEFYGAFCQMCKEEPKSTHDLACHHRHYRTFGAEDIATDVTILCDVCHIDLHNRHKRRMLNRDDIPFVDPQWEAKLKNILPGQEKGRRQTEEVSPPAEVLTPEQQDAMAALMLAGEAETRYDREHGLTARDHYDEYYNEIDMGPDVDEIDLSICEAYLRCKDVGLMEHMSRDGILQRIEVFKEKLRRSGV